GTRSGGTAVRPIRNVNCKSRRRSILVSVDVHSCRLRKCRRSSVHHRDDLNQFRIVTTGIGQGPSARDGRFVGTASSGHHIGIGGIQSGGTVVGLIGHVTCKGKVCSILVALDGHIGRHRKGRCSRVHHRDGLN